MAKPISSWKYEGRSQTSPWRTQSDWNKGGIYQRREILLKFANLDNLPLFLQCPDASFGLLSNDTSAQLHQCQALHSRVHARQLCLAYWAQDRKWPMGTGHCQRTYTGMDIFLYVVMQWCCFFPAPSHPTCRSLSRLASVPGTWAVANTDDVSTAGGETQDRLRGHLMFRKWHLTGWQQLCSLYYQFFLKCWATCWWPALSSSLSENRALTGTTTLCILTRVFCAYVLLRKAHASQKGPWEFLDISQVHCIETMTFWWALLYMGT